MASDDDDPQDTLRAYFRQVVIRLLRRGEIRRRAGESIAQVLQREAPAILREVENHFITVGVELGLVGVGGLLRVGVSAAQREIGSIGDIVGTWLNERLAGKLKR